MLVSAACLVLGSCRGVLSNAEGTGPSAGVTSATNALTTAAEVAQTAVPGPWGTLLASLFGLSNAGLIAWSAYQQKQIGNLRITLAQANGGTVPVTTK